MNKILTVAAMLLISACSSSNQENYALSMKINDLESKISDQKDEISSLQANISKLTSDIAIINLKDDSHKYAILDPSSMDGFQRIDTSIASLTVTLKDVRSLADGSRVVLTIGNITNATINGVKLTVDYGSRQPKYSNEDKDYYEKFNKWSASLSHKEADLTDALYPGAWNVVEVSLPGVKPESLGFIKLTADANQISLRKLGK